MPTLLPPPIEPLLRPARPNDARCLAALTRQLGSEVTESEVAERLEELIENRDHAVLVATMTAVDPPVGWIHVVSAPRLAVATFAEIVGMVVDGHHRGQGIGRRLVLAAETWARNKRLGSLRVRSRRERQGAHAFYRRLGFVANKSQTVFDKKLGR